MAEQSIESKTLTSTSGGVGTLLKAALPSLPVIGGLPGIKKASREGFVGLAYDRPAVTVEREQVEAYAAVCGFPKKDTVPLPFPHMLAFPLHMAIMTDSAFPAPAIGTVHLENSITGHRPIAIGESLVVATEVSPARAHPKGAVYDFVTTVRAEGDDAIVWESTSTYLRRGKGDESASTGASFPDVDRTGVTWPVAADLGRRYAAVSGDHNPIHLYPVTAKALGFPRQIAHGMWSKARCIAALENRLPDAVRVDVAFKTPILLPGKVSFGAQPIHGSAGDGYAFALKNPKSGAPHVVGTTTAL